MKLCGTATPGRMPEPGRIAGYSLHDSWLKAMQYADYHLRNLNARTVQIEHELDYWLLRVTF